CGRAQHQHPAHSTLTLVEADGARHIAWQPGHTCPPALLDAAAARLDAQGHLDCDDDGALPMLLRGAADAGHRLVVDEAVWLHLAAHRDARHRLLALEAAYPAGPVSPALQRVLTVPLPAFQAEGALFSVVAGRALIADERGLGKTVQSIAAATLWRRHFGVRRVLVLCAAARRASWQRSWQRFAGASLTMPAQVIEGGMHQRQAQWSVPAEVRIMGPEALDSDAAHLAHWAPELVIVDEPMQVPGWTAVSAPQALVITAGLVADDDVLRPDQHALLETLVDWLDVQRLGPLAALRRIRAVRDGALTLDEAELDALDIGLSRVMLQRLRSEVEDQLPPRVHSERLVPLESPQRQAHDRLLGRIAQLLDGWQRSGWLSDADQWRLGTALRELPTACHRSDPADPGSPLADATVGAMQAQLDDWAASGASKVTIVCAHAGDQAQLSQRLSSGPALQWVMADAQGAPAPDTELVLQVGVPWRPRRGNGSHRGQQWLYMVGQDSLEGGLFETLALRADAPRGPADGGGRAYLQGERLAEWLHLLRAAVAASAPVATAVPAA
uniref:SNF2-related protein n=1 Tax=Ideonella sp. A 288 TaxID=1962181 RepID=UPI000B4BEB79